jgi:hypothetical protein
MQIYSLFMFLGIFTTLLIPETKRLTLEQLSGEERIELKHAVLETDQVCTDSGGGEKLTDP